MNSPLESNLGDRALAFAAAARDIGLMDDLVAALLGQMAPLGLTAVASGLVSGAKAASSNPFHFVHWRDDWLAFYQANDFLLIDPVPRWARNSGRAVPWSDLFGTLTARDPGRKVIEAAERFGYSEGMVVPARAGDNSLGLISFGGARVPLNLKEQIFLTIVGRSAFEAAERIENKGDIGRPGPILSRREIDSLILLVRGHSDREIAGLLGVSEPTVRFHLGNAREKLCAVSRTHLGALAVAQGYVAL